MTSIQTESLKQKNEIENDNYDPLIKAIKAQGWKVNPFVVKIAGVRNFIHTRSIELLESLHIYPNIIKKSMKTICHIAIKYSRTSLN
jgi:hypothetical protein